MIILWSFIQKIMLFVLCIFVLLQLSLNCPLFCFANSVSSYLHVFFKFSYVEGKLTQLGDAFSELILKKEPNKKYFKQLRKE